LSPLTESIIHGNPPLILGIALATAIAIASRRRVKIATTICAVIEAFLGTTLIGLMATHILGVIVRRVRLKEQMWVRFEPHVRIAGVPYDFRFYALILFGVLGGWAGLCALRAAVRMARGDSRAWRLAASSWILTAALVAPLLPLQDFAAPVLCMCAVGLAIALVSRAVSPHPVSGVRREDLGRGERDVGPVVPAQHEHHPVA
jgi:hypothetical protein